MRPADTAKAAQWRGVIAEQRSSGKSVAAYCRRKGVSAGVFHWWKRRLGAECGNQTAAGKEGFIEVAVSARETESGSGVELRIGERLSVRLARGFDEQTLKAVLSLVAGDGG